MDWMMIMKILEDGNVDEYEQELYDKHVIYCIDKEWLNFGYLQEHGIRVRFYAKQGTRLTAEGQDTLLQLGNEAMLAESLKYFSDREVTPTAQLLLEVIDTLSRYKLGLMDEVDNGEVES
jgi:hypothetical protein